MIGLPLSISLLYFDVIINWVSWVGLWCRGVIMLRFDGKQDWEWPLFLTNQWESLNIHAIKGSLHGPSHPCCDIYYILLKQWITTLGFNCINGIFFISTQIPPPSQSPVGIYSRDFCLLELYKYLKNYDFSPHPLKKKNPDILFPLMFKLYIY